MYNIPCFVQSSKFQILWNYKSPAKVRMVQIPIWENSILYHSREDERKIRKIGDISLIKLQLCKIYLFRFHLIFIKKMFRSTSR